MDALLGSKSFPPGFRFHPTDEELFMFYLKRKVLGKSLDPQMMSELDVFQYDPWELPAKACLKTRDLNWYFLSPRSKKYPNGGRCNRATVHGYWKSTGNDRTFCAKNRLVGKIKTLIFHRGKAPKGERTDWVLHEYRLEDRLLLDKGVPQDSYVLCKVFEKSGLGPKNGKNYGAPFVEEEWDSDGDDYNLEPERGLVLHPERCDIPDVNAAASTATSTMNTRIQIQLPAPVDVARSGDGSVITGTLSGQDSVCSASPSTVPQPLLPPIESEEEEFDRLLALFAEGDGDMILENGSFNGLEELIGGSLASETEFYWSQFTSDDHYLELSDLHD